MKYCRYGVKLDPTNQSLKDEKLDTQNNGRNITLFDVYFENCSISTYLLCFSTRVHIKKNIEIRRVHV